MPEVTLVYETVVRCHVLSGILKNNWRILRKKCESSNTLSWDVMVIMVRSKLNHALFQLYFARVISASFSKQFILLLLYLADYDMITNCANVLII